MNSQFFITHFDKLGHKPKLFFKQNHRHTSLGGAIISILVGLGICIIVLFYFIEFFLGTRMTVISSKDSVDHSISFDLKDKLFMIQLADKLGNQIDTNIADLHAVHWETDDESSNFTHFKLERCEYGRHFSRKEYDGLLANINISNFLCFEPQSNILSLDLNSLRLSSYFTIYVATCTNTTSYSGCYNQEDISEILNLSNHYFTYIITNTKIDHKNISSPLTLTSFSQRILLIPTMNYDYTMNYRHIEYASNKGWLINNWLDYSGFQFEESLSEKVVHTVSQEYLIENTYASFKFRLSFSTRIYEREFPKLQTIVADVSAMIKIVVICGQLLVELFSSGRYYDSLFTLSQEMIKSKVHNNGAYSKDTLRTKIELSKKKRLNPIVYCEWMIYPKMNRKTAYVEACRRKIGEYLSVENIIKKLYSSEIISALKEKVIYNKNISSSFVYLNSQLQRLNLNDNYYNKNKADYQNRVKSSLII